MVDRFPIAVVHLEPLPIRGEAGRKTQFVHFKPEPQERFDDQPVHPGGRARVPGPAAAAGMRRHRIDVGGNDVGFHFVGGGLLGRSGMVHRVDHGKELPCAPVVPQAGERHGRPDGRMGVLPAVFSARPERIL